MGGKENKIFGIILQLKVQALLPSHLLYFIIILVLNFTPD